MTNWLQTTFTGKHIDPTDLRHEDICIEDIAHALALCNRFAGHSKKPISVAQHSVYVVRVVEKDPFAQAKWIRLQALLHDAAEAYLGDITRWIKRTAFLDGYRLLEHEVQSRIYQRFDLPMSLHPSITKADRVMVRFEARKAFGKDFVIDEHHGPGDGEFPAMTKEEEDLVGHWSFWDWKWSEQLFLDYFRMITT